MENTYWNKQGQYQADYDRLLDLMPTQQYYIQCSAQRIVAWYKQGYYLKTNGKWYSKTATGAEYIKYSTA